MTRPTHPATVPAEQTPSVRLLLDGLLTIKEAVAFSRVSRPRLYQLMRDGRLCFVRNGAKRLIPKKALCELLAESLVPATA